MGTGVALQADPGLAEPCAVWALEVCICRWDTGCQVAAFSGGRMFDVLTRKSTRQSWVTFFGFDVLF